MSRALTLAAVTASALLLGCEAPSARESRSGAVEHQTAAGTRAPVAGDPEDRLHDTGGADPTAVSGRVKETDEDTIHHPGADGNSGRPDDGPGARGGAAGADPESHSTMETHR